MNIIANGVFEETTSKILVTQVGHLVSCILHFMGFFQAS